MIIDDQTRNISKPSKWLLPLVGVFVLLLFVMIIFTWATSPGQLLKACLGIERSDKITRLETNYHGLGDTIVKIYLEADENTINDIISHNNFIKSRDQFESFQLAKLRFDGVPGSNSETLEYYEKHEGTVLQKIAVNSKRTRLWYGHFDY